MTTRKKKDPLLIKKERVYKKLELLGKKYYDKKSELEGELYNINREIAEENNLDLIKSIYLGKSLKFSDGIEITYGKVTDVTYSGKMYLVINDVIEIFRYNRNDINDSVVRYRKDSSFDIDQNNIGKYKILDDQSEYTEKLEKLKTILKI